MKSAKPAAKTSSAITANAPTASLFLAKRRAASRHRLAAGRIPASLIAAWVLATTLITLSLVRFQRGRLAYAVHPNTGPPRIKFSRIERFFVRREKTFDTKNKNPCFVLVQ